MNRNITMLVFSLQNFVGLSVSDGYIATGSETNEVTGNNLAYHMLVGSSPQLYCDDKWRLVAFTSSWKTQLSKTFSNVKENIFNSLFSIRN